MASPRWFLIESLAGRFKRAPLIALGLSVHAPLLWHRTRATSTSATQRGQFQRYGFVFPDPNLHHRSERYTLRRGYDFDFPIHDSITGSIRLLADRRQWIDEHCDGHWQPKPGHWVDYDRKQLPSA